MDNLQLQSKSGSDSQTRFRWIICALLFFATTINYMDRQVLSLTWEEFIKPEFHWTNNDYGNITSLFSICYAISMVLAGRFIDWMDTRKGFLWAIAIWSVGACIHAFCGIGTAGLLTHTWGLSFEHARQVIGAVDDVDKLAQVAQYSVTLFIVARVVLALGEAGNFPAAIKTTAEYFPKKDRAYATSLFNSGATIGAMLAPLTIPPIAKAWGWETSFIVIGALGFVWMFFWAWLYHKPHVHPRVNQAELAYIHQDHDPAAIEGTPVSAQPLSVQPISTRTSFIACLGYRQTWAFAVGKFLTDGVWWFFLFWTPAYLTGVYGLKSSQPAFQAALFTLYAITLLSILGGWLPSYFVARLGMNPYEGRMKAMLIFAFFPLLALAAQPLGKYSYWFPTIIIGIAGAAHQAWSANIFSTVSDMFPKKAIATITGIGGMAGGIGSFLINKSSGLLFDYARLHWTTIDGVPLLQKHPEFATDPVKARTVGDFVKGLMNTPGVFDGINTGYMIVFSACAVAYLLGWVIMKILVPRYQLVTDL